MRRQLQIYWYCRYFGEKSDSQVEYKNVDLRKLLGTDDSYTSSLCLRNSHDIDSGQQKTCKL